MSGLWQVDPHPVGSRVTMRFAYRAAPSIRGGLFAIALHAMAPLALRRIFAGWRAELRSAPPGGPAQSPATSQQGLA